MSDDHLGIQIPYRIPAGRCTVLEEGEGGIKVTPEPDAGHLIFNVIDTGFLSLRWCKRGEVPTDNDDCFALIYQDAVFIPWLDKTVASMEGETNRSPINGRIYVLKFKDGGARQFFWLQTPPAESGDPDVFSEKDLKHKENVKRLMRIAMGP